MLVPGQHPLYVRGGMSSYVKPGPEIKTYRGPCTATNQFYTFSQFSHVWDVYMVITGCTNARMP